MQKQCAKLLRAKLARNDEFYTQYADIESECDHYRSHFLNKCIYCNCDTADSAFVKYFAKLKSQGLIKDVWFSGGLGGTDFRSPQAIELLQRADVVVTNPPFSLFRDFMDLLIEYQKPFLVIGNKNAIAQRTMLVRATSPNVPICGRPEDHILFQTIHSLSQEFYDLYELEFFRLLKGLCVNF